MAHPIFDQLLRRWLGLSPIALNLILEWTALAPVALRRAWKKWRFERAPEAFFSTGEMPGLKVSELEGLARLECSFCLLAKNLVPFRRA
jgi:hypothetical protein